MRTVYLATIASRIFHMGTIPFRESLPPKTNNGQQLRLDAAMHSRSGILFFVSTQGRLESHGEKTRKSWANLEGCALSS